MNETPLEDQVHDALHRRVDPLQHSPLTVAGVRRSARRIQRRRRIAAGAAVAAALAVAVPVGLSMNGPAQRSEIPPATQTPRVTGPVVIDVRTAPQGDATTVPIIDVDTPSLTVGDTTRELPETYDQITPYLDGWLAILNVEGTRTVRQLGPDFEVLDQATPTSPLTVSTDGARIAWAEYDGTQWYVVDRDAAGSREERRTAVPSTPAKAEVRTVGFLPDDGVVVARTNVSTGAESTLVVSPDSDTTELSGFVNVVAASPVTGMVAGQTSSSVDGSCSQAADATADVGSVVWQTCEHSVGAFSPDGQHLVGFAPYVDGEGSTTVSLLDAADGSSVVDFEVAGARNQVVGISDRVAWEDDETLIVTLVSGGQQYVVRLGLDRTVQLVAGPGTVEPGAVALLVMPGA